MSAPKRLNGAPRTGLSALQMSVSAAQAVVVMSWMTPARTRPATRSVLSSKTTMMKTAVETSWMTVPTQRAVMTLTSGSTLIGPRRWKILSCRWLALSLTAPPSFRGSSSFDRIAQKQELTPCLDSPRSTFARQRSTRALSPTGRGRSWSAMTQVDGVATSPTCFSSSWRALAVAACSHG